MSTSTHANQELQAQMPKIYAYLGILLLALVGMMVNLRAVERGPGALATPLALGLTILWFFTGRQRWWLPVPLAVSFGGLFWVGFRIYTYELSIILAVLALAPLLAMKPAGVLQGRPRLLAPVYGLFLYLCVHLVVSVYFVRVGHTGGTGNVVRAYVGALWPVIFSILFYLYGDARYLRPMLLIMYAGLFIRTLVALYSYFNPGFLYFPVLGTFFLLSETGALEWRDAAFRLFILALGLVAISRSRVRRAGHLVTLLASVWFLILGSSRVQVAMALIVPTLWLVVQRRWALLALFSLIAGSFVLALNLNPEMLFALPPPARRALSILVVTRELDIHRMLEGSNEWHALLMRLGWERWTEGPVSFLFGNRIVPFNQEFFARSVDFVSRAEIAASVGRYESSLWAILATLGLAGLALYVGVFWRLLRDPFRELWRTGIHDLPTCLYFITACHFTLFALFAWIAGGFPGYELALATMSFAVFQDERRRLQGPTVPPPEPPAPTRAAAAPFHRPWSRPPH